MRRTAPILLTCLALASCAPKGGGETRSDAAIKAACRERADQIYDRQHRGEIYSPQSGINTPFSGNYAPSDDSRGLSQLFARDSMIDDCVRHSGNTEPTPAGNRTAP